MRIGFIGGGSVGGRLANLLQAAGHDVVVGLRNAGQVRANTAYRVAPVEQAVSYGEVVVLALHYRAVGIAIAVGRGGGTDAAFLYDQVRAHG